MAFAWTFRFLCFQIISFSNHLESRELDATLDVPAYASRSLFASKSTINLYYENCKSHSVFVEQAGHHLVLLVYHYCNNYLVHSSLTMVSDFKWSKGPFVSFYAVGGMPDIGEFMIVGDENGAGFDLSKGLFVKKLQVWYDNDSLTGIQATWTNGNQSIACGGRAGNSFEHDFDYANGEKIEEMILWGNGVGAYCGAMRFKTSKRTTYSINSNKQTWEPGYHIDVGCGILAGFCGLYGDRLNLLGCVLLAAVDSVEMSTLR